MLAAMGLELATLDERAWSRLRCRLRGDVTVTDLGDQLVLLDPRDQQMYALDAVGRFVWETLPGRNAGAVATAIAERYRIEIATARRDLRDLLIELDEADLLREDGNAEPQM